jgi:hypothetical protein
LHAKSKQNYQQPSINKIHGISETHIRMPSGSENQSFGTAVKDTPSKHESSTAVTLPELKYEVRVHCDESS